MIVAMTTPRDDMEDQQSLNIAVALCPQAKGGMQYEDLYPIEAIYLFGERDNNDLAPNCAT